MHPARQTTQFDQPEPSSAVANEQRGLLYLHFCFGESYLVLAVGRGFSLLDPAPRALDPHQLEVCLPGLLGHGGRGRWRKGLF